MGYFTQSFKNDRNHFTRILPIAPLCDIVETFELPQASHRNMFPYNRSIKRNSGCTYSLPHQLAHVIV